MTIGYILDDTLDRPDGVQQAILAIGEEMRARGHEVHYIVTKTERTDVPQVHDLGRFWRVSFNGNSVRTPRPVSKRRINRLFSEVSFDVLHVQMPHSPLMAGRVIAAAPKQVRVFGTFHILPYNFLASFGTKLLGSIQARQVRSFQACFAVSPPALKFLQRTYGVKGTVLANPVQWDFFHSRSGDGKSPSRAKQAVVFVGRFEERKGVLELIQAYSQLSAATRESTELILCGKGPLHQAAAKLADELHIKVTLPGYVSEEEKADYLAQATIAVFPSMSGESFGIVLAEAMAAGSEVTLGGNNPGYQSVLEPWPETLFNPRDHGAFARTLEQFLQDEPLRKRIGSAQHAAVKAYDVRSIARQLERTYNEASTSVHFK